MHNAIFMKSSNPQHNLVEYLRCQLRLENFLFMVLVNPILKILLVAPFVDFEVTSVFSAVINPGNYVFGFLLLTYLHYFLS